MIPSGSAKASETEPSTYAETLRALFGLRRFGVKLGLTVPRRALARLGDPHLAYPVLHVAGTNGKGSTSAFAESILRRAGLRTGLFTSPHLNRFTERIQVGGEEIPRQEVVRLFTLVSGTDPNLTFFERTALMAFRWFAEQKVDVAVVEVGLGGRLDVTNLVRSELAVICQIAMDHGAYLGNDLNRIAWEKGGILQANRPAILAPGPHPGPRRILANLAHALSCPVTWVPEQARIESSPSGSLLFRGRRTIELTGLGLAGPYQHSNAAAAVAAVLELGPKIGREDLAAFVPQGLEETRWPGRFESVTTADGKRFVLDAAHNPSGVAALLEAISALPHRRLVVVAGSMSDKDVRGLLSPLVASAHRVVFTRAAYYRAAPPASLAALFPEAEDRMSVADRVSDALDAAGRQAGPEDLILVTGSVFLLGEVRRALLDTESDPFQVTDPVAHTRYLGNPLENNAPST